MEIDYKIIGQRIKEVRNKKGWTQGKLSEELDVTEAYMSRVERGEKVNLKMLAKIASLLDSSIEYFITGVAPKSTNYLDKELYEILSKCTPEKQRLIYNIASIVANVEFV